MKGVTVLWPDESLKMDADRLAGFYLDLGEARANLALASAVADLEALLADAATLSAGGSAADLARLARRIRDIAEPLGFCSLARVATDAAQIAPRCDPVALAAVLARLQRQGGRTLKMVWDLQDLSG